MRPEIKNEDKKVMKNQGRSGNQEQGFKRGKKASEQSLLKSKGVGGPVGQLGLKIRMNQSRRYRLSPSIDLGNTSQQKTGETCGEESLRFQGH